MAMRDYSGKEFKSINSSDFKFSDNKEKEEEIKIGDNIVIKVLGIKNKQVKLGIEAPKEANIVRTELLKGE